MMTGAQCHWWGMLWVAVLAELIAAEMSSYADPVMQRSIFGVVEPDRIAAMLDGWVDRNLNGRVERARVVVKAYPPERTRGQLEAVLRLQTAAADAGMPAPRSVAGPASIGEGVAVAETALDVGRRPNLLDPADRATAAQGWVDLSRVLEPSASLLAEVTSVGMRRRLASDGAALAATI